MRFVGGDDENRTGWVETKRVLSALSSQADKFTDEELRAFESHARAFRGRDDETSGAFDYEALVSWLVTVPHNSKLGGS